MSNDDVNRPYISCRYCGGEGWVCENHRTVGFDGGDGCKCGGAGMPCICNKTNPPWNHIDKRGKKGLINE